MAVPIGAKDEAALIAGVVKAKLARLESKIITGEAALSDMLTIGRQDLRNYGFRQIEWPAFYFEFMCLSDSVKKQQGWSEGPSFGRRSTQKFDLAKTFVWDLKCHDDAATSRLILNDCDALDKVYPPSKDNTKPHSGVGFVILCGKVIEDSADTFRKRRALIAAEEAYKGARRYKKYSNPNKAYTRALKASFEPTAIKAFYLHERSPAEEAKAKGGVLTREKQPHNAVLKDGTEPERDDKYHLRMDLIEDRGLWLLEEKL